jgi:hypothetical protein
MNKSFAFFGREREIGELRTLYTLRKHVVIVGPGGIGKTALLKQIRQHCPVLVCDETSSLRRICNSLERLLGWVRHKLNVIERKNRLLAYLICRGEPVAFDHVTHIAPRVARFIAHLAEQTPIWIACRSDQPHEIGHLWPDLYKFQRIEISPLTALEARALVEEAVAQGNIQVNARKHADELHRMSGGNPRILEELLIELAAREYKIDGSSGLDLLDLDRRIHEIDLAVEATVGMPSRK